MNRTRLLIPPRQQKLEFEQDDLWKRLSESAGSECQALVAALLVQVIRVETQHSTPTDPRRSEDERQDQR
jgi:hypothetical protein